MVMPYELPTHSLTHSTQSLATELTHSLTHSLTVFPQEVFEDANHEFDINTVRANIEGQGADAKERHLKIQTRLLDFSAFPYIRHTGVNIAAWIVSTLHKFGLSLNEVLVVVPDGAANGKKACRKLHVPYEVCHAHNFQRVIEIAHGRGSTPSENPEMKTVLRKVGHQSRSVMVVASSH